MTPELSKKIKSLTGAPTMLDACAVMTIEDFCSLPVSDRAEIRREINTNRIFNNIDNWRGMGLRRPYRCGVDLFSGGSGTAYEDWTSTTTSNENVQIHYQMADVDLTEILRSL
jgi:hypothetical protein